MDNRPKTVVAVNWTEYERDWGSRPDGHTLHLTFEAAKQYIQSYWARQPNAINGRAPDDYSAPGEPFGVDVDGATFEKIVNAPGEMIWGHTTNWR